MFSIVLPVYNVEMHIERCLLSLQRQEFNKFEMVFVDDCGSDKSVEIIERYAEVDPRIRIVKNSKNLGTYHARRVGVESAQGDYIVFLDPDDELEPKALSVLSGHVSSGNPDLVFFGSRRVPAPKLWFSKPEVPSLQGDEKRQELLFKIIRCNKLRKGTEGKAFNRSYLKRVYCFLNVSAEDRLVYGEDKLLFFGAIAGLNKAASIHDELYVYHKNEASITVVDSVEAVEMRAQQIDRMISYVIRKEAERDILIKVKDEFLKGFAVDKLRLQLTIDDGFLSVIRLYWKVFGLTKSVRDLVKLSIFVASGGRTRV